ncbi:MAG: biopolymer transporter ExbD [Thalassospira sp.]|nr:biopolymer transporter ExbD [Thalassospira sp.]MRG70893.1 biopolymer transporter ExbD [Alphaproteobacteria bacterium HT1-32]|tara:strand:+ start:21042 stop:21452 length:411 start_codon:yes stop_codon:yes gene_type:complete
MKIGSRTPVRRDSEQSIMPLINIVFLLLIFFMVAGQLTQSDPVPLDPPVSVSPTPTEMHGGKFLIAGDGRLFYLGQELPLAELSSTASGIVASGDHDELLVKADAAAPTGLVLQIISDIRRAGAPKVRLVTVEAAE